MQPFKKKFPYKRNKKAQIKESNIDTIVSDSESDEDVSTRTFKKGSYILVIVESPAKCSTIEKILGVQFLNKDLLKLALTHRSYANERKGLTRNQL